MHAMREFHYHDATSDKFWHIDVVERECRIHFGRVGTKGQEQTKTFATPTEAHDYATKQITSKMKKGYVERGHELVSDEEAFHRALQAQPHDLAGWIAFADFLLERDDPRGAFMHVQIALEDESLPRAQRQELQAQETTLWQEHGRAWLGELAPLLLDPDAYRRPPTLVGQFSRGWLRTLRAQDLTPQQVAVLGRCPEARHLLHFAIQSSRQLQAFGDCPTLQNVRHLELGSHPESPTYGYTGPCLIDLERLLPQVPQLEKLCLYTGDPTWGQHFVRRSFAHLRHLEFLHNDNDDYTLLARNESLRELRELHILPGNQPDDERTGHYLRLRQLQAICHGPHFTKLRHLTMRQSSFGDDGAQELVESGLLGRLQTLSLYDGRLTQLGVKTFAESAAFRKLRRFQLDCANFPPTGAEILRATGVDVSILFTEHPLDDLSDRRFGDEDDFYDDDWE